MFITQQYEVFSEERMFRETIIPHSKVQKRLLGLPCLPGTLSQPIRAQSPELWLVS